jgi:hypothetical protein
MTDDPGVPAHDHHQPSGPGYIRGCEKCKARAREYRAANKGRWPRMEANRRQANKTRRESGRLALALARQLERGDQVANRANHHLGMALLKGPRPDGMTLSLVNPWGPASYWGYNDRRGNRYRLSTDPNDYVWETHTENLRRGYPKKEAAK